MNRKELRTCVKEIIGELFDIADPADITGDMRLYDDLSLDQMDLYRIFDYLETRAEIRIPDEVADRFGWYTVDKFAEALYPYLKEVDLNAIIDQSNQISL